MGIGKNTCEALKEIRKRIADANGIPYEPIECTHEGDCPGTCPMCEQEIDYLTKEVAKLEGEQEEPIVDNIMPAEEVDGMLVKEPVREEPPIQILGGIPARSDWNKPREPEPEQLCGCPVHWEKESEETKPQPPAVEPEEDELVGDTIRENINNMLTDCQGLTHL